MSKSKPALPYRVLTHTTVVPSALGWAVIVGNETLTHVSDGAALPMWDAQLSFRLERDFVIMRDLALELGLDDREAQVELVVTCATGGATARSVLFREDVPLGGGGEIRVVVTPQSQYLARDMVLTTGLYLSEECDSPSPLAPRREGSRLWEITERIRLEGGAARLPIYEVPFSQVFAGDGIDEAEFHVEITSEFDVDVEAGLAVYVNAERPDFVAQLNRRGSDAERRLWSGILRRVVLQVLLSGAVDDVTDLHTNDANSVTATAKRWASFVWPDVPPSHLRELASDRYALCEAQIDAWLTRLEASRIGGANI